MLSLWKLLLNLDLCLMKKLNHKRSNDISKVTHTARKGAGIPALVCLPLPPPVPASFPRDFCLHHPLAP